MSGDHDISHDQVDERVWTSYDRAARGWRETRPDALYPAVARLLEIALEGAPPQPRVLDAGCGAGVPVGRALVERGCRVTGLDASAALLEIARAEVPEATFVHGDMRTVDSSDVGADYDLIVAWDSVFHIPRDDHALVFSRFASWLRGGGRLLLSLGVSGGEFTSEMLGETFFYSGFPPEVSVPMLETVGFTIVHSEIDDPRSRGHFAVVASAGV